MQNNSVAEIRTLLANAQRIALTGHTNPDGDCIGAVMGLAIALKKVGKQVQVLLEDYSTRYDVIADRALLGDRANIQEMDLFVALDCGDAERLVGLEEVFANAPISLNIDHHKTNTFYGDYNYVQAEASSACEVVYDILDGFLELDQASASAFYAGIVYDTGGFRHSSTSPKTMQIASELMHLGAPFTKIYTQMFEEKSFSELKIVGHAMQQAELYFDGKLIVSTITQADLQAYGSNKQELGSIVNGLKGVKDTAISCFLYEKSETEIKASFRAEDGYDVGAFCAQFGGGGHVKAAGCSFAPPLADVKACLLKELEKMM